MKLETLLLILLPLLFSIGFVVGRLSYKIRHNGYDYQKLETLIREIHTASGGFPCDSLSTATTAVSKLFKQYKKELSATEKKGE